MYEIIFESILIASASAFGILLIGRLGLRDEIVMRAPRLISQLFECDFCLSFWVSLILAVILALVLPDASILITPLISTPLTRILI